MCNGLQVLRSVLSAATPGCFAVLSGLLLGQLCAPVFACPFCDAPTTTLGEQMSTAHVTVLAEWVSTDRPDSQSFAEGKTTYRISSVTGPGAARAPAGSNIQLDRYNSGRPGDLCLLFAALDDQQLKWSLPTPVSRQCWDYLNSAPARSLPVVERLPFYLSHLENSDPDISMDAYGEFAAIPYDGLKAVAGQLPRKKILDWLSDPVVIPTRRGLYGLMLGLCGTSADVAFLREIVEQQPEESRLGIDGIMAGYLLLSGAEGLQSLTDLKFADPATPPHEVYALLQALRFLWTYEENSADRESLRKALRKLLTHPQFAGLVIVDLARWQDWQIMDQLVGSYGQAPLADSHARQSIVRFLMIAEQDARPASPSARDFSAEAKRHLDAIRKADPRIVKYVETHPFD